MTQKAGFRERHRDIDINSWQRKMLKRLLESGERFKGGKTTRNYAGMSKYSKVTASRDLKNMEEDGLLQKRQGGGRSTSYELPGWPSSNEEFRGMCVNVPVDSV